VATFREEIRRTQLRGYSTDDRENEPFGACVGAAIVRADGRPAGAISISGPYFRIHDRFEYFGERVRAVAGAIARELGADAGVPTDGSARATSEAT
jgi:IclR family acetate operon transcriptional repressor